MTSYPRLPPSQAASEEGYIASTSSKASYRTVLTLAYQSLGIVYGDLSTSPLYVYKTTFSGKLSLHENDEEVFGVLSFIFWTFTLIPLLKYICFVLSANDNGEGGTFALYSLLCRHARLCILPNQQVSDEELSTYSMERTADTWPSSAFKDFCLKQPRVPTGLLIVVLLGTCMTIGDGVLTPAISVLSAVSGVRVKVSNLHGNYVVAISCVILVALFSLQHHGTHRVGFMFAPIVTAWLLCISGIGVYNIVRWNLGMGFIRGVVLSITGAETMFANLGHFSPRSIKIAFTCLVYPCLVLAYMGEAAFLSKHHKDIQQSFYKAIPEPIFWPVFVIATLAAVVGSQAVISATFSVISQCCSLNCFPRVKIVHTSNHIHGQIYIPEINWILMCLCLTLTIGLRNTNTIGHAYGLAVTTVIFVTTCLMSMVIVLVWKKKIIFAIAFLVFFGSIELMYISASVIKIPEGGWIPLALSLTFMIVMYIWNYGTLKKHAFDLENKVSVRRILELGPVLGIVRVPGIALVYADLVTGVPAFCGHFAMNLPAFHQVLVFVCVKSVQVPYVSEAERFLISRIGPNDYHMFRCIVRYGYKDSQESYDFEDVLVSELVTFVETEDNLSEQLEVLETEWQNSSSPEEDGIRRDASILRNNCSRSTEGSLKTEALEILQAKEFGIVYILGRSQAQAKKSSALMKRFAIDYVYNFLSRNCRGPDILQKVPHSLLLEVGMVSFV